MSKINDGGPAFPFKIIDKDGFAAYSPGMTLRDFFAAKAMQSAYGALCASDKSVDGNEETLIARLAYKLADAMLAERANREGGDE